MSKTSGSLLTSRRLSYQHRGRLQFSRKIKATGVIGGFRKVLIPEAFDDFAHLTKVPIEWMGFGSDTVDIKYTVQNADGTKTYFVVATKANGGQVIVPGFTLPIGGLSFTASANGFLGAEVRLRLYQPGWQLG